MAPNNRSGFLNKSNESARIIVTALLATAFGYFLAISISSFSSPKVVLESSLPSSFDVSFIDRGRSLEGNHSCARSQQPVIRKTSAVDRRSTGDPFQIFVETNPPGAELLPPAIVVSESDFYLRRLWGDPDEDLKVRPRYLVAFAVGYNQRRNINAAIKKFSSDFTIVLFHYDGRTSEWDQYEWSRDAIHVSVRKQTKWWYAKRFLHPDVVGAYDYIFIWDEDLGLEHFNAQKYITLVKQNKLEISQPALEPSKRLAWKMTIRKDDSVLHKGTIEEPGLCSDPHLPPCAAFVEMIAPVFSKKAWSCVWHLIQNDLVHGWGLDFELHKCVEPAHEKIGVIDSQWIVHKRVASLGKQARERGKLEWSAFQARIAEAEKDYL